MCSTEVGVFLGISCVAALFLKIKFQNWLSLGYSRSHKEWNVFFWWLLKYQNF
ncbi:hypothetical protein OIU74_025398 [Salix koriyanagi]|uniref:Uncharacterized protein n=1 Tax=Salix koriyanagi TaxID=2511006 RepID=A0A9Q0W199_9ROSI|nr:hypothetical protein OIU74_025398 [Salix koriyanagi]